MSEQLHSAPVATRGLLRTDRNSSFNQPGSSAGEAQIRGVRFDAMGQTAAFSLQFQVWLWNQTDKTTFEYQDCCCSSVVCTQKSGHCKPAFCVCSLFSANVMTVRSFLPKYFVFYDIFQYYSLRYFDHDISNTCTGTQLKILNVTKQKNIPPKLMTLLQFHSVALQKIKFQS